MALWTLAGKNVVESYSLYLKNELHKSATEFNVFPQLMKLN